MAAPTKDGPKKSSFPVSSTERERDYIRKRAKQLGFKDAPDYLFSLVEAERRLGLVVETDEETALRWFSFGKGSPQPVSLVERQRIDHYLSNSEPDRIEDAERERRKAAKSTTRAESRKHTNTSPKPRQ